MRITILTFGAQGEVRPYVALGAELKQTGHHVRIATHNAFQDLVCSHGQEFFPVAGDPRAMIGSEEGSALLESGNNPIKFFGHLSRLICPIIDRLLLDSWNACQGSEVIIFSLLGAIAYDITEKLKVPCCIAPLQPLLHYTKAFPNLFAPADIHLNGAYNRLTYFVFKQLSYSFWRKFYPYFNQWRKNILGLPKLSFITSSPWKRILKNRIPFLYGYSPSILPKPNDWPDLVEVIGYWFLNRPYNWKASEDLVKFLNNGSPPVYIGFGSMISRKSKTIMDLAIEALKRSGQRGILAIRGGEGSNAKLPDYIFKIDMVPHDWLFPQMSAIVCHGGAGTVGMGLRFGIPIITIPLVADQPFWGQRIVELGVGCAIKQNQLNVESLSNAIRVVSSNVNIRTHAAILGKKIQAEEGIKNAIEALHRYLPL